MIVFSVQERACGIVCGIGEFTVLMGTMNHAPCAMGGFRILTRNNLAKTKTLIVLCFLSLHREWQKECKGECGHHAQCGFAKRFAKRFVKRIAKRFAKRFVAREAIKRASSQASRRIAKRISAA